jgi:predicted kinase
VPNLIVLNGPPGIGKSVLARRYVDDHPLALDLDIDLLRELLGRWGEHREQAGLLARRLALEMARTHLLAGFDVVIPQYLARPRFLDELDALAAEVGIALREFVLLDTKENWLRRWAAREALVAAARRPVRTADQPGEESIGDMYDRLLSMLADRPAAVAIRTEQGKPAAAYQALSDALGSPDQSTRSPCSPQWDATFFEG